MDTRPIYEFDHDTHPTSNNSNDSTTHPSHQGYASDTEDGRPTRMDLESSAAFVFSSPGDWINLPQVNLEQQVDSQTLVEVVKQLQNPKCMVTSLSLASNNIDEMTDIVNALKVNRTLTELNLADNRLDYWGATTLAKFLKQPSCHLVSINLDSNGIGDAGIQDLATALKANTGVASLNVGNNDISDVGAMPLAEVLHQNATLTRLDLPRNKCSSKGAVAFADALLVNTSLTSLDLGANEISSTGIKSLAMALKTNATLTSLNLSSNSIMVHGSRALANSLAVNYALTSLNLSHNKATPRALAYLLWRNDTLRFLDVTKNTIDLQKPQHRVLAKAVAWATLNSRKVRLDVEFDISPSLVGLQRLLALLMASLPKNANSPAHRSFFANPLFDESLLYRLFSYLPPPDMLSSQKKPKLLSN